MAERDRERALRFINGMDHCPDNVYDLEELLARVRTEALREAVKLLRKRADEYASGPLDEFTAVGAGRHAATREAADAVEALLEGS